MKSFVFGSVLALFLLSSSANACDRHDGVVARAVKAPVKVVARVAAVPVRLAARTVEVSAAMVRGTVRVAVRPVQRFSHVVVCHKPVRTALYNATH